ncbi:hypothetical protein O3P69_006268 [Scylla paramamosain]|uniref:Uncharacterized protein n=1 Tax=Scylla paramamosain TaxID=85552 RepID=A0AAW0U6X4_SCYPA
MQRDKQLDAAQKKKAECSRRTMKGTRTYDICTGMLLVVRRNLCSESRKGGKTEPNWIGSYIVLDAYSSQRVALEIARNGRRLASWLPYHQSRPYLHRELLSNARQEM